MAEQLRTESVENPSNGATGMGYVARRFGREGFFAIAPDLYHGRVATEPDEARKLAISMDRERAAEDIDGAIAYLAGLPFVEPKKVGAIGFCMGGSLSLFSACRNDSVAAAAVFHGGNMGDLDQVKRLRCPLFDAYGEKDDGIPLERIEQLREALTAAGKQFESKVYPGAPHSFFNDTRPSYRPEAAQDAWQKSLALFRAQLQPRAQPVG